MTTWSGRLGDALELLIDHRGKTPKKLGGDWSEGGIPVYSAMHVKGGRLTPGDARFVSEELYEKWMPVKLQAGDVLLTSEAPLGEVAYLDATRPACLGQRLFALRGRRDLLDGRYLFYLLQESETRHKVLNRASGTTVSGIRQAELVEVELTLPEVPQQRAIADVLAALDDKIESNRRRAVCAEDLLDVLASTLPATALVEIGQIARVDRVSIEPSGLPVTDHYSLPAFDAARLPERVEGASIRSSKLAIQEQSVLVSRLNPGTNRTWYAVPDLAVPAIASTEWLVLRPVEGLSLGGLWLAVRDGHFRGELARRATGTSGSHQRVRPADALSIEVPDPRGGDAAVLEEADALLDLVHHARVESETLGALRDTLLPELLSGRLRVPDAKELVADAI